MDSVTVIGRFKVDHRGMQIGHNPFLIQWQDGEKKIVYPRKLQTAAPRF
jgi:branched-chain amino acid transport system substrate-binding protein